MIAPPLAAMRAGQRWKDMPGKYRVQVEAR